jgi:hypothetical protein
MDTDLKKQTTSIFRVPPEDANSNLLQNTVTQTTGCPNLHHIMLIHHREKLKQKRQWMVHAGKTELQVSHYVLNQHCMLYVAALCTRYSYGLYCLSNETRE